MPVLARKQLGGEAHFVIRQLDGTLTLLPEWMAAPAAASFRLIADPRLPVDRLLDMRILVDALLASSASSLGESSRSQGGGYGRDGASSEGSVREPSEPTSIPIDAHQQMLELLKELLTEALTGGSDEADVNEEDGGDEDHA